MDKKALKKLREARKATIERTKNAIKSQTRIIQQIKQHIGEEAKTVPEIAQAAKMPTAQVLLYISGLKKYGLVAEAEKDGDYFKYRFLS